MSAFDKIENKSLSLGADCPVAIFINKAEASHVGLIYWKKNRVPDPLDPDSTVDTFELHLIGDERLLHQGINLASAKTQMLVASLGITKNNDPFNRRDALSIQLERLGKDLGKGIPFGPAWLEAKGRFDAKGQYIPGAGSLTCATFVNEALAAFGFRAVNPDHWPKGRPQDIKWKNDFIHKYANNPKITDERKKILIAAVKSVSDENFSRLLPSEMAYVGSTPSNAWPLKHLQVEPAGIALVVQFCSSF